MAQGSFEFDPSVYDAVFLTFHDWAQARKAEMVSADAAPDAPITSAYQSNAKKPTIPFAPLTREIGISPVEDTDTREMTRSYQQQISSWVGLVKRPFDSIQRAEGFEEPDSVFIASQKRAARNNLDDAGNPILDTAAGRAAVHRQYNTTRDHFVIASDRTEKASSCLKRLKEGGLFENEEKTVIIEILQEFANGVGANLDHKFIGGDLEARIAGNSILTLMTGIENGTAQIKGNTIVVYAAVAYVKKQAELWKRNMNQISRFANSKGFTVGIPKTTESDRVA